MTEPDGASPEVDPGDYPELLLLIDPNWEATPEQPEPVLRVVVGAWVVHPDGSSGPFEPNPVYEPTTPGSPTDPVDAVLQLLARRDSSVEALQSVLHDTVLGVALEADGSAVVTPAPDGVASVVVATSPTHRRRMDVPGWRDVSVSELAAALPADGVDVLLNPGGPASMRVLADVVREAAAG
ncbi:MAG: type VII secretion system-associated protein [Pseudonocardia sediminis]